MLHLLSCNIWSYRYALAKPYKPASNLRLDPELYEQAGIIVFITIRSYRIK